MIYLELFIGFLKVGLFSFGGAYAAIPLIRDVVLSYGWLDDEMLTYMIAVSESTPGPIMVNLATYIGTSQAGIIGGMLATFVVVLPAFIIILIVTAIMSKFINNKYVKALISGIMPCVIGIILATGSCMIVKNIFTGFTTAVDIKAVIISVILAGLFFGIKKDGKKLISPIALIAISAVIGMVVNIV